MIGHAGHDEVIGTLGEAPEATLLVSSVEDVDRLVIHDPERMSYLTQTTLSLDETRDIVKRLKERFPAIKGPKDAGHLLRHGEPPVGRKSGRADVRRAAGGWIAETVPTRGAWLRCARTRAFPSYLLDDASEVNPSWLENVQNSCGHRGRLGA